jgi:hypothetical protein
VPPSACFAVGSLFALQRLHVLPARFFLSPVHSPRFLAFGFSICLQRPLRWRRPRRSAHLRPAPTQQWAVASMCTVRSAVPCCGQCGWHGGRYGGHITRLFHHLPENV